MREALDAGVDMINDINGFRAPGALSVIKESDCGLCIMHMQRDPATMQLEPRYEDVVQEVGAFLKDRAGELEAAGTARNRICIDPGFGFGKNLEHNLDLLRNTGALWADTGLPVLVGMSRKSMIGAITGRPVEQRLAGSIAAHLVAAENGARILRVHDVAETVDAIKVWNAVRQRKQGKT
jgi:dihydropteroate synthase